jgi:XTP/dITP diphosphohydrolase
MDKVLYELRVRETERRIAEGMGLSMKKASRRARFKSVITLMIGGKPHFFEGTLEGVIAYEKSGNGGFGYDPIFIADEYPGQTLADITEEQKNEISHRGKALRAMAAWLQAQK